ncbi:hypothetical protein LJC72_11610 [Bacteroides sp. OttesenSCG-928-D19]|nr:hypothetical protein [Bacteroides sp. OttesenSCG-928-N06]MDL2305964.1 hypothetical protein [Bacteroides sp. OttesenSCG-928-D19]
MNKIYGLNLDALRLCYEIKEPYNLHYIKNKEIGETIDFFDFYLLRIDGKYYEYVYQIRYNDLGENKLFGELRFGLSKDNEDANKHSNGNRKAWISLANRVLYNNELYYLDHIAYNLGLKLHNITALDLCLDMSTDIARQIKKLMRNQDITTILNGKQIFNRKEDRPEITYVYSGDMDRDKYLTVNIKQKKAIKDKSKGTTLLAYNKKAEINNSSGKDYIKNLYQNPSKLHRLEIHLNNEDIKRYMDNNGTELSFYTFVDMDFLFKLFLHSLRSILRFRIGIKEISWIDILTGDITTSPTKAKSLVANYSKTA